MNIVGHSTATITQSGQHDFVPGTWWRQKMKTNKEVLAMNTPGRLAHVSAGMVFTEWLLTEVAGIASSPSAMAGVGESKS